MGYIYLYDQKKHYVKTLQEFDINLCTLSSYNINAVHYENFKIKSVTSNDVFILSSNIIHTMALEPNMFKLIIKYLIKYQNNVCVFIQDDYYNIDAINDLLIKLNIKIIFTVMTNDEDINKIYYKLLDKNIKFIKCLTGYVSDELKSYYKKIEEKKTDIIYRAKEVSPYIGILGYHKVAIGYEIKKYCIDNKIDINHDISWKSRDRINNKWYDFISNSKTTLATPSGSNVLNFNDIKKNEISFSMNDISNFEGEEYFTWFKFILDKFNIIETLNVNALSPKMFESIACGTVLIMLDGDDTYYSGVLKPNIHYIPLKHDYSNIPEVIEKIKDDNYLQEMANRAYKDIIESNNYSYKNFISLFDKHISTIS